jgi:hypothetical protein
MSLANTSTLTAASAQWASRPNDERFVNLIDLAAHCDAQRRRSAGKVVSSRSVTCEPVANAEGRNVGLTVIGKAGNAAAPTHFAFGQLANLAGAPAGYLRTLDPALAADCVNFGLKVTRDVADVGLLLRRGDEGFSLDAATGPNYGRVWNTTIADALVANFGDGIEGDWRVPGEFGKRIDVTKANTTLYAGDRDMFVFLADEENRITLPNRRGGMMGSLARGFFVRNSEVGAGILEITAFLFDYACCNRIVWGAQDVSRIAIRHTSGAPDRWLEQALPVLETYRHSAASPVEAKLIAAQAKKVDNVEEFLKSRKFTSSLIARAQASHEAEEGRPMESVWDVVTGLTAAAKGVQWQDDRVSIERAAGKLLDLVAA